MSKKCINSPIGPLTLTAGENGIISVTFEKTDANDDFTLLNEAEKQLSQYFSGKRREFSLPLDMRGTPFQIKVWNALLKIPYGQTASYKDIACAVGNSKACRAVGNANNKNPLPILIPCHRVIGSNAALTGYAGGLEVKKFLLDLEKKSSQNKNLRQC